MELEKLYFALEFTGLESKDLVTIEEKRRPHGNNDKHTDGAPVSGTRGFYWLQELTTCSNA